MKGYVKMLPPRGRADCFYPESQVEMMRARGWRTEKEAEEAKKAKAKVAAERKPKASKKGESK